MKQFENQKLNKGNNIIISRAQRGLKLCFFQYGKHTYDHHEGTLVFLAPGYVIGVNSNGENYHIEDNVALKADKSFQLSLATPLKIDTSDPPLLQCSLLYTYSSTFQLYSYTA
jgi:hypothetical protein